MEWYEWIFDGVGTAIISAICGFLSYKAAIKKMSNQSQNAGDNSKQKQKVAITNESGEKNVQSSIRQIQKAGNNSEQFQTGSFENGK